MKELIELFAEKVGRYPRGNVQDELRSWAANEITTLRQQLAESKEREATSFYQGVCTTLAMIDPHSTEYHESVLQHGGYHVLWEVASDYDKEHLLAAAKANYGGGYEVWLSQESGQPSKQEGSGNE